MEEINVQLLYEQEASICLVQKTHTSTSLLTLFENKEKYQPEVSAINTENRKRDFLAVRYALKMCLNGREETIAYTKKGKPTLENLRQNISISHCKNWVSVIIHPTLQVGIDIEQPSKKLYKVAKRFLSQEEYIRYSNYQSKEAFLFLRIAWSAKEALFKIIGDCYNFSQQLHTLPFEIAPSGTLQVVHTDTAKRHTVQYILMPDYTLAYSIDNERIL